MMVKIIFAVICILACAFLIYALVQFCRETVRLKAARRGPFETEDHRS
jgi:hypothetical protein